MLGLGQLQRAFQFSDIPRQGTTELEKMSWLKLLLFIHVKSVITDFFLFPVTHKLKMQILVNIHARKTITVVFAFIEFPEFLRLHHFAQTLLLLRG